MTPASTQLSVAPSPSYRRPDRQSHAYRDCDFLTRLYKTEERP